MPNFRTSPPLPADNYECTVYHALPHTLLDQLRNPIIPDAYVNTTSVHETKMKALRSHESQQNWLDVSQKLNSYLQTMDDMSLRVGGMSQSFQHAEGWRRHLHYGFCAHDSDPLRELGADFINNETRKSNF
jgi:hypothetical protein